MTIMADLAALQEVDSEIDRLVKSAGELRARIADDPALRQLLALRNSVATSLQQSQLAQRDLEGRSQSEATEIKRREDRLASGRLKTPADYTATQHEIEQHTKRRFDLDDELIAKMEDVEAATARLKQIDRDVAQAKATRLHQVQGDMSALKELETATAAKRAERVASEAYLTAGTKSMYERLRQTKAGRAVSVVQGLKCGVCHVTVPSSTLAKARPGTALVPCETCGRLLYVPH
jgi:hypothetical protein